MKENVENDRRRDIHRTAIAGHADCLVTGDNDLLTLGEMASIPILSPRQFYGRLGGQEGT
jgi:predicted nucleic acid-binding protein